MSSERVKNLLANGMFVRVDQLEDIKKIASNFRGRGVSVEILGKTLLNGSETDNPDLIGIKVGFESVEDYNKFGNEYVLFRQRNRTRKTKKG